MLRITGIGINTFAPASHPARNYDAHKSWNIVEFKGNLPNCTSCAVGAASGPSALKQLKYFALVGTNNISSNFAYMFTNCHSLVAVLDLDTSRGTDFTYMFNSCYSLVAIPDYLNTGKGTTFTFMFSSCYSLNGVVVDISSVASGNNPFGNCYNLTSIKFTGTRTTWPAALSFQYSSLTATAVEEFFNTLPAIITSRAISLANTPAALQFTNDDDLAARVTAIATEKRWTVTL